MKYCLDANTLIQPWNTLYPRSVFPSLYMQIIAKLQQDIILIKPIFDQIDPPKGKMTPKDLSERHPLRYWLLKGLEILPTPLEKEVKQKAIELESLYETREHSSGADGKDMLLIAYGMLHEYTVVTLESAQKPDPKMKKHNYKIPIICAERGIECINFIEFLRRGCVRI